MRTPLKNMLATTQDRTVDIVIITMFRQKYTPENHTRNVHCKAVRPSSTRNSSLGNGRTMCRLSPSSSVLTDVVFRPPPSPPQHTHFPKIVQNPPTLIQNHSGGDSVALGIFFPTLSLTVSVCLSLCLSLTLSVSLSLSLSLSLNLSLCLSPS